jgi:hypothetical protein
MATGHSIELAKDIVVAWLGTTPMTGTKDAIAETIVHVFEKLVKSIDEQTTGRREA